MKEFIVEKSGLGKFNVEKFNVKKSGVEKFDLKKKLAEFWEEEDGMGVVEIVLIIIVLVGLVVLFKDKITSIVNVILSKMTTQIKQI